MTARTVLLLVFAALVVWWGANQAARNLIPKPDDGPTAPDTKPKRPKRPK